MSSMGPSKVPHLEYDGGGSKDYMNEWLVFPTETSGNNFIMLNPPM
jgi:hypothetical protein